MARRDDTDTTVYTRARRADGSEAAPLPLLDADDLADVLYVWEGVPLPCD